ncbi:MAG TPA: biotin transporter BioY [Rhabdochlamydiaceae bacterium]|nr:biotin transporter BioY [Rhabdochlamydiaceae bacterium]
MDHSKALPIQHQVGKISKEIFIIISGSIFLALLSQLAIPMPFTPIPMTLQTLGVFLLGGILGGRRAAYSTMTYLVQGCCGLPVFAGGMANPLWFLDCKAGFLISFIAAAFLIGKMIEKSKPNLMYILFSLTLGQILISGIGMAWLSLYFGIHASFMIGVLPFLSGAAVKILTGSLFLKGYFKLRQVTWQ